MYKFVLIIFLSISFQYESLDFDFLKSTTKEVENPKIEKNPYEKFIEGFDKKNGLFNFYWNIDKNKCYLEIDKNKLGDIFILNATRQTGDAYRYHGSAMLYEFPFSFKKVGSNIQIIQENVKFRANLDSAIYRAIKNNIPNSIFSTAKIEAQNDNYILVDASSLFIFDFPKISSRGKYMLDKKNSYFTKIKSFELNAEIDMTFHYKGKKPGYIYTLPNSSSMLQKYHISLIELKDSNYSPRIADDRVGHFQTIFQDYSDMYTDSPYIRYINRWKLEKKNPNARMSEPVEPIVFWVENTVPKKFRKAFRDGILAWNKSFEKIGFKNAIVAKQMPDDADWDPADINYNTVRWMIQPGSGIAVGPSRANPITGEIYDADVRVSSDWIRHYFNEYTTQFSPMLDKPSTNTDSINHSHHNHNHENHDMHCNYADEKQNQISFLWDYMSLKGLVNGNEEQLEKFVYEGIVDLILHEVGHTLGLRHNFKASSMLSSEELSNSKIVEEYNITSSVMDYVPANIFDKGNNFFLTEPGIYDDWAIAYAYSTCDEYNNEKDCLDDIISKSISNPKLAYGTDEDADECDPLISRYDMSSDPIEYYEIYLNMIQEYWSLLLDNSMVEDKSYNYIRNRFQQGLYEYFRASRQIYKFIGGVYYSRHHIGDLDKNPFRVVDAKDQRRAIKFLDQYILSEGLFDFPPDLLNKLAPTRLDDFEGTLWYMNQLDYPLHKTVKNLQTSTLNRVFSKDLISRVHDNEIKFDYDQEVFTLFELFDKMNDIVWTEIFNGKNINSFRREIQNHHLSLMMQIYNDKDFPIDAQNLAFESIKQIYNQLANINYENLNFYSTTHLSNIEHKIDKLMKNK